MSNILNEKKVKAVIFNMSGVLCDPTPYFRKSRSIILERYGVNLSDEEVQASLGQSLEEQLRKINKNHNLSLGYENFSEESKNIELDLMKDELQATKGAKELIEHLLQNNLKIGIASQNIRENINNYLKIIGLENKFQAIISVEDLTQFKPNPEIFIKTAEKLGVKPEECIMIDDSVFGMEASKKLGIKAIGFASTFQKREELEKHADIVIDSLEEVKDLLK